MAVQTVGKPAEKPGLEKIPEMARQLSVSRGYVYQLMEAGKLAYVKIGRCRRVKPEDVAKLIEDGTVGAK